ncbi:MAG: hypothetical protein QMD66_03205 [Actinomycetota bacterium]|nr:hypothetical protein [Actinomycetota bacterium]
MKIETPYGVGTIVDYNVPKEMVIVEVGEGLRLEIPVAEVKEAD